MTKTWSTYWLTVSQHVNRGARAFSTQDIRNLRLCIVCFVVNFNFFVWSHMHTPNWGLSVLLKKTKTKVTHTCICNSLNCHICHFEFITCTIFTFGFKRDPSFLKLLNKTVNSKCKLLIYEMTGLRIILEFGRNNIDA